MSLIQQVEPQDAKGKVDEVYQGALQMMGYVPNALKLHSINPMKLEHLWQYLGSIMQHPTLSGQLFAMIRMLVSMEQKCEYCVGLNAGMLINEYGLSEDDVQALKKNPENAPLSEKEKALLLLTLKAVNQSNSITSEDVQSLREKGCTDVEIYDAVGHGANQVWGDIMLNAFKVEIDYQ